MLRLDSFSHSDAKQRKVNAEPEYWGFTAGRDDARRGEARGDPYADEQEQKSKNRPSQNHPIIPRISEGRNGQIVGFVILVHIVCIFWSSVRSIPQTKEKLETCSSSDE
jgi:hypothetical protein